MVTSIILTFVIGYILIAFEHPVKLDKTVPAILMAVIMWSLVSVGSLPVFNDLHEPSELSRVMSEHLSSISEILVFLLGAMTIVELVDLHQGFSVITNRIRTTSRLKMLWIVSILAFFLSSVLDNLTTTIVFISLLRRLVDNEEERKWYAAMVIIAANAGGAWTPIGDVTTTMLWIGGKVTTLELMRNLFIPSVICLLAPLLVMSRMKYFQGQITPPSERDFAAKKQMEKLRSSQLMLAVGVGSLVFVPVFKALTHMPPYMGMMLGLGVTWLVSEYVHPHEDFNEEKRRLYSARYALSRIEISSILFFLGILMAVASMESLGLLAVFADKMQHILGSQDLVAIILGMASAVIDNVPLVAASMGMYTDPMDAKFWHFIAYTAGTGGSMLIIGSAAGVAAMGMEKIDFIWYLKKIAWLAAIGYFAGIAAFLLLYPLVN